MLNDTGRCVLVIVQIKKKYGQKMVAKAKACAVYQYALGTAIAG